MSVNSSTYSLATLVLGGGALLLAIVYLYLQAPAELANTEYSQYYRAGRTGRAAPVVLRQYSSGSSPGNISGFSPLSGDIDLLSLVSSAIKIYSKLNEEDED